MRSTLSVVAFVSFAIGLVSCYSQVCNCPSGGALRIIAADPITSIILSGPPCSTAKYKCDTHLDYDSVLTPDCTTLDIAPVTVGVCTMNVTVGGMTVRVERKLVSPTGGDCAAACNTIVAVDGNAIIDLRPLADGGTISNAAP